MDYKLTLLNKSNGSPLYLLIGPENLTKRSSNLKTIAQFIIDNFELEEVKINGEDENDLSAIVELEKVLQNLVFLLSQNPLDAEELILYFYF
jgi:hypothetical protein